MYWKDVMSDTLIRVYRNTCLILPMFLVFLFSHQTFAHLPPQMVKRMAHQFMKRNHAPGVAIAIYDNGNEALYQFGVANKETGEPITKTTHFEIGSITKSFNALILAQAIVDNKITLNQTVNNFLPEQLKNKNIPVDKLTFKQLATHTASLPKTPGNFIPFNYTLNDMLNYLMKWQPKWPPGTKYQYSNLGFGLLGIALEGVYGQSFTVLLSQKVLQPLSMSNTFDTQPDSTSGMAKGYGSQGKAVPPFPSAPWRQAAGGIRSTNEDMLKFLKANLMAGNYPDNLKKAIALSQKPHFIKKEGAIGLAWEILERDDMLVLSKGGRTNGFTGFITFIPKKDIGIVVMTNKNGMEIRRFANALLFRLLHNCN